MSLDGGAVGRLTGGSVAHRWLVVGVVAVLMAAGGAVATRLKFDAMPDVTNNQVLVLTGAPGFSPEEVERLVTRPLETALGGVPGLIEQRSISRFGISSVTAVFADSVPPYLARQVTQERLSTVSLPAEVEAPSLGPLTGGLGEIFHFAISSASRTPAQLLELATFKLAPRLRTVPGVVEVNTWGGQQRVLEVRADPLRLPGRGLTLPELRDRLRDSMGSVPGASLPMGASQALLRATWRPTRPEELGGVLLGRLPTMGMEHSGEQAEGLSATRVSDVAEVAEGAAVRLGAATRNGRGETVYLMVQMLRGENALEVVDGLHERMVELRRSLPPDIAVELIYDRSVLVHGTLRTVGRNLLEGGLLVVLVLLLFLGSLRAGLLVALAIPLSMLGAAVAMVIFGVPGNLMSLGALDFGLLVDGAVVMIENIFHQLGHQLGHQPGHQPGVQELDAGTLRGEIGRVSRQVARPVLFSVLIILLVYVPVLGLGGVEGKMFQPMALTVVFALLVSLLLALTFMPAAASLILRPRDLQARPPLLVRAAERVYRPLVRRAVSHPLPVALLALALLVAGGVLYARAGSEFVPQLDEGDLVIQTTRAADIGLGSAVREAGRMEAALLGAVPEVKQVVSRIGSPAVATDIMGLEQADVFVALKPRDGWRRGLSRDRLIREMSELLAKKAPGSDPSFTQPIQMRFNEILAGAVTDVAVSIYGDELGELRRLAEKVARECEKEAGAADVRVLAPPDVPLIEVKPRALEAGQAGLSVRDVLESVQALRTGVPVAMTYDGPVRIPVVLRLGVELPSAFTLAELPLPTPSGGAVRLGQVADVVTVAAPSLIQHENAERRLLVGFNVRGADLGTLVQAVQRRVARAVKLPSGYRLEWGGQYESLVAARERLAILVPLVLLIILTMLWVSFRSLRSAVILFLHVPFACTGGMIALAMRGLPVSISAAIGFIALSGIAVLNGVVLLTYLLELRAQGQGVAEAALTAAESRMRPVLMTALVAALGFVPMMLAEGVGAEVQRPLATVVVGGLVTSTALTLFILPSLYPTLARPFFGRKQAAEAPTPAPGTSPGNAVR